MSDPVSHQPVLHNSDLNMLCCWCGWQGQRRERTVKSLTRAWLSSRVVKASSCPTIVVSSP